MRLLAAGLFVLSVAFVGHAQEIKPWLNAPLFSESFDDADLLKRGFYDGSKFSISETAPFAGRGSLEYAWETKGSTPANSSGMRRLFEPSEVVYLRCYLKLQKDWGWSGRSYHPHLMHFMTTENGKWHGPAASHLTVYIEPVNGKLRLAAQDIQNKDQPHGLTQGPLKGGYNGTMFDSKEELFVDDKWHCIEAQFQLNTLDLKNDKANADGIVRGWFDDKLVIERTDVILRSTDFPKMQFNQFLLTPYFGPGLLPKAQSLWIDELAVGTTRVGAIKKPADDARAIRELVEQLASANPPPITQNTPSYELPRGFDFGKQADVDAAERSLRQLGVKAFPYLFEGWDDERYCTTEENALSGAVYNLTVGRTCRAIVFDKLQPYGYWQETPGRRSVPRRPSYPDAFLNNRAAAEAWWETHRGKSLHALQLEVVEWVIAAEAKELEKFGAGELATLQRIRDELKTGKPLSYGNYYQRDREFRLKDPAKAKSDPFAPSFSPPPRM